MANTIYKSIIDHAFKGDVDIDTDVVKGVLVDLADYTFSAAHEDLADIPVAARVSISAALTGVSITDAVLDIDDFTFTSVTGDQSEALILMIDSGSEATSWLIAFIDTATGLPITPDGGNINTTWDNGANKVINFAS